ncbi:MAG: hypothetical protein V1882_12495 [Candidatus Omnitrophota bacterium]
MKKTLALLPLIFAIFCGTCLAAATAEDIRVMAEVDKAFLTIGDPVTYTVTVEHAPDIRVLSSIPAPTSDFLEIKKVEDINRKEKKSILTGRKFVLTSYRLGEFILDPVSIQYRKDGQPVKSILTNKLYLTVKSVAGGETQEDIRDVKSIVPYKFRFGKFIWAVLVLILLGAGYFLFQMFLKKKNVFQPEPVPLSAEEEALLHLRELFESDLLKQGLIKIYYLRLSEVLRTYFEKRYKILAVESTTLEILRALRPEHLQSDLYQKIQYVLESSDLAKFAKWIPTATETFQINKKAEEVVQESAPAPAPVEQASAEASHGV